MAVVGAARVWIFRQFISLVMKGIGVSSGICIGRAYVLRHRKETASGTVLADQQAVEDEVQKYFEAVCISVEQVEALFERALDEERDILEVQLELIRDAQMECDILERIRQHRMTARDAVLVVTEMAVQIFEQMDDEYLKARGADVQDAGNRIVRNLLGHQEENMVKGEGLILVADDLAPSDTIGMDKGQFIGFATQTGAQTSHVSIVARLRGLPAVVGCGMELGSINNGDLLILDGSEGLVLVNPIAAVVEEYRERQRLFIQDKQRLDSLKDCPAVTLDGVRIGLQANIAKAEDMEQALFYGAEGIGLLRTELLFMDRDSMPDEEEQFIFYKEIVTLADGRPVTIRTLDIGGDKHLPYLQLPKEDNPFLGYRAIRISLDRKELFVGQLRAILRASVFGPIRILLPMITNPDEVRQVKAILEEIKRDLVASGIPFDASVPLGVMIEVPAAALIADLLAMEADFFSIGTNDLCQYVLAVDRMNEHIKELYNPFHPAVLRLICQVIEQGHAHGIAVGICGELAGDPRATSLLLGMGLREFSMASSSIPLVKNIVLKSTIK